MSCSPVCVKLPAMAAHDKPARRTQEFTAIGWVMKVVIAEKGLSRAKLADRTGIDYKSISKHLRGQGNPTYETLKRLCDGMGVSLGEVMVRAEELAQQDGVGQGDEDG
jgi:transcriptional regulator with XRE-family HTH domain